jgi:glycosyltransferase involved in cell wall biosynthesis
VTATLRVVLDQLVAPTSPDLAEATRELTRALVATAPKGTAVAGIAPRGDDVSLEGLTDVSRLPLPRRELAASWSMGVAPGVGAGLIHSPTLLAPLVRHDRVHDTHQVVATLWDLDAWERPESLPKADVLWQKAMLKRAQKHADAIVVPSHAMAARLAEIAPKTSARVRVIGGAPPTGFRVPTDAAGRLRALAIAGGHVATGADADERAFRALAAATGEVVVLGAMDDAEADSIRDRAAAGGLAEGRLTVLVGLDAWDRAAVLSAAELFLAPVASSAWPWRAVEALAVGAPVVAVDSPVHREVLADGALLVDSDGLADAIGAARGPAAVRLRVLAADRGRSFSWRDAAERTWALHAEL